MTRNVFAGNSLFNIGSTKRRCQNDEIFHPESLISCQVAGNVREGPVRLSLGADKREHVNDKNN